MRLLTLMAVITLILAAPLGLLDLGLWFKASSNMAEFLVAELGFRVDLIEDAFKAVYETLVISLFGVSSGTLIAYILAPLASPMIVGSRLATLSRLLANAVRSIPAIFWAILFVILVGPGPRAGALALALYTAAYLAKFFYEILESVDREHVNSLKVMGLSGLTLASAMYAHTRSQVVSSILFMLEYNVRTAAIIGFVGAGGVGYYILHYMSLLDYPAVITFIAVTMLFVIAIDTLSYLARTRV